MSKMSPSVPPYTVNVAEEQYISYLFLYDNLSLGSKLINCDFPAIE